MKNQNHLSSTKGASIAYSVIIMLIFLAASLSSSSQTQQRKWFLNGKDVDYTVVPPSVATTSGVTVENAPNQKATNALCNRNNARLFSINGLNLYADQFSGWLPVFPMGSNSFLRPEIAICPKPGSCDSFYMFYSHRDYYSSSGCPTYQVRYYVIDPSLFNSTPPETAFIEQDIELFNKDLDAIDNYCPTPPALALGKEKILNGVKTRHLFVLDYEATNGRYFQLKRFDITPSGINPIPTILYSHPSGFDDLHNFELELSPDGQKLAFGRSRTSTYSDAFTRQPDKDIVLYHLNDNGTLNTSLGTNGLTFIDIPHIPGFQESIVGLEFNAASSRLFASVANDAIWYVSNLTASAPTVNPVSGTQDFTFSQMELVYNNGIEYIAVAKNQSNVHVITNLNSPSPTISTNALFSNAKVPENTNYPIQAQGVLNKYLLCLPDQVDGDNYTPLF